MAPAASPAKILVVDDSDTHRAIVRVILAGEGYEVVEAGGGIQGVTTAFREMPDLIVSDVIMPDLSGYQLCRFLKHEKTTLAIPIILMTATELSKQDRFWGLRSGADRYVPKESVRDVLVGEVAALLEGGMAADDQPAPSQAPSPSTRGKREIRSEVGFLFDKLLFQTTIAHEVQRLAAHVHSEEDCLAEVVALIGDLTDFRCLSVHLVSGEDKQTHLAVSNKLSRAQLSRVCQLVAERSGGDANADSIEGSLSTPVDELVDVEATEEDFGACCVFRLKAHLEHLGSLSVFFDDEATMTPRLLEHLQLLANEFASVARLLVLYQENRRLSVSDGLTRLFNVRYFRDRVEEAFANFTRYRRIFSLVIMDLDHFKPINDEHGHAAGDLVLRRMAKLFKDVLRRGDVLARYGGDEFVALLPETPVDGALVLGERLRREVRRTVVMSDDDQPLRVTLSVGVAEISNDCEDGWSLLSLADEALYESKRAGRNAARAYRSSTPAE